MWTEDEFWRRERVVKCVSGGYSQITITVLCSAVSWVSRTVDIVAGFLPGLGSKATQASPRWVQTTFAAVGSHKGFNGNLWMSQSGKAGIVQNNNNKSPTNPQPNLKPERQKVCIQKIREALVVCRTYLRFCFPGGLWKSSANSAWRFVK